MPTSPKVRSGAAKFVGRPSLAYLYFLLTMTAGSLLIARDWFHPHLELLHRREFVQGEMGFFYKQTAQGANPETEEGKLSSKAVKFLDLNDAAYVRGPNFEEDGYTLNCPEGQGPLFPTPLSILIAFPNAGLEWLQAAFHNPNDQGEKVNETSEEKISGSPDNEHMTLLRNLTVAGLLEATEGQPYRAVLVVRDPRDLVALSVLKSWSEKPRSFLERLFSSRATSEESKQGMISREIDSLTAGSKESADEMSGLLGALREFAEYLGNGSLAFVRYEDMWQRNPKGGWPAIGCWLGLQKHHVDVLVENQQRLEAEGFFAPGRGSEGYGPGIWQSQFSEENVRHFKTRLKGVVSWLGYQRDENWEAIT